MSAATARSSYCPTCDRTFASELTLCPTDGGRLVRIGEDPLLGRTLDERFRLDERIGSGGMGAVYRAWQLSVGRPVAVKVIRSQAVADEAAIKRFLREAQLASRLNHPHIVSIIDFGQTPDGLLYLVMELCAGRSLDELLRDEGPLSIARTIAIALQICDGLQSAHRQEIIHRDLKPSNLMQLEDGDDLVKILDFGLARSLSGDHSTITRSDVVLGTPTHLAPEVLRGQPFDVRSDLYALGVVVFTLLSGYIPYEAESVDAILGLHITAPIPDLPAAFPPALNALVRRLLAKNPAERYASATQLKDALLAVRQTLTAEQLAYRASRRGAAERSSADVSAAYEATAASPRPDSMQISRPISGQIGVPPGASGQSVTAPVRSRRWLWTLPVALAAMAGIAIWQMPRSRNGRAAESERTTPLTTAPVAPPVTPPVTPVTPATAPLVPSVVRLTLDGEPDATVFVDGKRVGVLPMVYTTERSEQPLVFRFQGKAKQAIDRSIVPDRNQALTIDLPKPKSRTKSKASSGSTPGEFIP